MQSDLSPKRALQLERVKELAQELEVEIYAHFYQRLEVKAAAHFVGGSYEVVEKALKSRAKAIMLCGASFMADEFRLRGKLVLLIPRDDISCPLADAVSLEEVRDIKRLHPKAVLICDMKARPEIKALAKVETSSSPKELLSRSEANGLITAHLGSEFMASSPYKTPLGLRGREEEIIALPGSDLIDLLGLGHKVVARWPQAICQVHHLATLEDLEEAKATHPKALILANLLCRPEVKAFADFVSDSAGIKNFCLQNGHDEFIIVSETGLAESLSLLMPEKKFFETEAEIFCPNMKLTNLKSMIDRLEDFAASVKNSQPKRDIAQP